MFSLSKNARSASRVLIGLKFDRAFLIGRGLAWFYFCKMYEPRVSNPKQWAAKAKTQWTCLVLDYYSSG
jgi:hypothetical protein